MFTVMKNSDRLNQPIDYSKFIIFVAILAKGNFHEQLLNIFSIFGKGVPERILSNGTKAFRKHGGFDNSKNSQMVVRDDYSENSDDAFE